RPVATAGAIGQVRSQLAALRFRHHLAAIRLEARVGDGAEGAHVRLQRWKIPGNSFRSFFWSALRALNRWFRTVDSPHPRISATSFESRPSISRSTNAAFCFSDRSRETRSKSS